MLFQLQTPQNPMGRSRRVPFHLKFSMQHRPWLAVRSPRPRGAGCMPHSTPRYRGLGHPWGFVSVGGPRANPCRYRGTTKFLRSQVIHRLDRAPGVDTPHPRAVQGSTAHLAASARSQVKSNIISKETNLVLSNTAKRKLLSLYHLKG